MRATLSGLEHLLHRHRFALLWAGFAAVCLIAFVKNWGYHLAADTPSYAVGDLLLNYAGGMARRGLLGQIAIFLSQVFGGLPWIWAWALGCALTGALFMFCLRLFRRLPDDPIFVPLILAPWGLLFYAYDEGAALRKELLAYLALVLILQAMGAQNARRALVWVVVGSVVFLTALFAHETIVLTGPVQALAVMLVAQKWPRLRRPLGGVVAVVAIAAAGIVVSLALLPKPDVDAICAATQAGCHSSAKWLGQSIEDNIRFTLENRGARDVAIFGALALLCAIPLLGFRAVCLSRRALILGVAIAVGFILPLFVIAADWGRWVQMALYPLCLVALAGLPGGFVQYHRILPAWAAVVYVASWNLMHAHSGVGVRALLMLPALFGIVLATRLYRKWQGQRHGGKAPN
jgi:hypothetical protein